MKAIVLKFGLVTGLMMLFISATPSGVMPENRGRIYKPDNINTKLDKTSVAVKDLHELTKKLCED